MVSQFICIHTPVNFSPADLRTSATVNFLTEGIQNDEVTLIMKQMKH